MLLVLDHIKQGMDAVGTEIPSQTSNACGTDGGAHQTENSSHPKSGNSQVIHLLVCCSSCLRAF